MDVPLTERYPQQPSLFTLAADGLSLDFHFARCDACAGLNFPANVPGCRHCGATLINAERITRAGGGTLLEFVTLHVPMQPGMLVPSIAGDIQIADGVVVEGVIGASDETRLSHGMALRAIAVATPTGAHYTCRFVPAQGSAA